MNRPSWPPVWLIAIFSAILGLMSGIVGQTVMLWLADWFARRKMRRALYLDLANMFMMVDDIMNRPPVETGAIFPDPPSWRQRQLRRLLFFRVEKYCLDNPMTYMQLPERFAGEGLYPRFHNILEDPVLALPLNTDAVLRGFALYLDEGVLDREYFHKVLGRRRACDLLVTADRYGKNGSA